MRGLLVGGLATLCAVFRLQRTCEQLAKANVVPKHARAITLLKGLHVEGGRPQLFSDIITSKLDIVDCCVLSGKSGTTLSRDHTANTSALYLLVSQVFFSTKELLE